MEWSVVDAVVWSWGWGWVEIWWLGMVKKWGGDEVG